MRALSFAHAEAVTALVAQIEAFVTAARSCDDLALLDPSRCRGWSRLETVVHVRGGLEEMGRAVTARTSGAPDTDAASYWRKYPDVDQEDPVDGILWLRRTAGAYRRPTNALRHLEDVATGVSSAVAGMDEAVMTFQGCRMRSGDFLGSWVVELAVHQLDLDLDPEAAGEVPGLAWVRRTLEALADADLPADLDDRTAVLVGLGRVGSSSARVAGFPITL